MASIVITQSNGYVHEYTYQVPYGNHNASPYSSPKNDRVTSPGYLYVQHNHQFVDGYSPNREGLYSYFLYIRFVLTAPKGALVAPTTLILHSYGANSRPPLIYEVVGVDVDDAPNPASAEAKLDPPTSPAYLALEKTTAYVPWTIGPMPAYGEHVESPDISSILTELCGRSGWVTGNHVGLIVAPQGVKDCSTFVGSAYGATYWQTATEVQTGNSFTTVIDPDPGEYIVIYNQTQATIIG